MSDQDGSFLTFSAHPEQRIFKAGGRIFPMEVYRTEDIDLGGETGLPDSMRYSHYRQALIPLENKWILSVIWGSLTYSSNRSMSLLGDDPPFSEEPWAVEVVPLTPAKPEGRMSDLWGDPLGWVTVGQFHELADAVMRLPSTGLDHPDWSGHDYEGEHNLNDVDGVVAYLKEHSR